jgi:replicative DNA helicase
LNLLDDAEAKLLKLPEKLKSSEDAGSLVKQALKRFKEIGNSENVWIRNWFTKLDTLTTSGWQPSI